MRIKENLVLRRVGSEYIIIVPEKGSVDLTKVHSLNESLVWLWEQLEKKDFTVEEMAALIRQRYEVEWDRAMRDVCALVDRLREEQLITED